MPKSKSPVKPNDGEGDSGTIPLSFNLNDPTERKAYKYVQLLAQRGHGARKRIFMALILALKEHELNSDEEFNPYQVIAYLAAPNRESSFPPNTTKNKTQRVNENVQIKPHDFNMEGF